MWIMIAGPYRTGAHSESDRDRNLLALNRAAVALLRKGHVPIIGVNLALPMIRADGPASYESIRMPLSLALADRCDAVLRLDGLSTGADEEVERIRARGGAVFHSFAEVPTQS